MSIDINAIKWKVLNLVCDQGMIKVALLMAKNLNYKILTAIINQIVDFNQIKFIH